MNRDANVGTFVREFMPAEFATRVLERFAEYADTYGASHAWGALSAFQRKLTDEITDVASYAAIVHTRTTDSRAKALCVAIAERAAEADRLAAELSRLLIVSAANNQSERVA